MQAELISIGDEILIGQISNTNSVWIAQQLNLHGIKVAHMSTVGDDIDAITSALDLAASRASLVIMTGGLGPTRDDITKEALAAYFNAPLQPDKGVLNDVEFYLSMRGHTMGELNQLQAMIPAGCTVIRNHRGTAPGLWLRKNGVDFCSLPGVPYEMRPMLSEFIIPEIKKKTSLPVIAHRTVHTLGIGESNLAHLIADWETKLRDAGLSLAYLPQPGQVRLRISGTGNSEQELDNKIAHFIVALRKIAGGYIYGVEKYGEEELSIVGIISRLLKEEGQTLALAESCTGGYLSSLITAVPGATEIFRGAIVPYTNTAKHLLLNVDREIFETYGAVSEACVVALAENVRDRFGADYGLSISGVAGPSGGSPDKPVGTVWMAVATAEKTIARKHQFGDNREFNIITSANAAADLLRRTILHLVDDPTT